MANEKSSYHKKWWVKTIRERNYFGFRYWWFNWVVWSLACLFLLYGIFFQTEIDNSTCLNRNNLQRRVFGIEKAIENCCSCNKDSNNVEIPNRNVEIPNRKDTLVENRRKQDTIPRSPQKNCRVHFSGLIMGGQFEMSHISEIYKEDYASEYVGAGHYPDNESAFPKAVKYTFDGIAIDRGTRLIIYSSPNFMGEVLLDVTGPAIINNVLFIDDSRYNHCNSDNYPGDLQSNFPQSVRKWSSSDMQKWNRGSCKITCNQ